MRRACVWLAAGLIGTVLTTGGCATQSTTPAADAPVAVEVNGPMLDRGNWTQSTYDGLVSLVSAERDSGKYAIFDFDNTTQARDIGEATTAQTEEGGVLTPDEIPAVLVPPLVIGDEKTTIDDGLLAYYQALVGLGSSQRDPFGAYASDSMIAQFWTGKTVKDFVRQVKRAYADGAGERDLRTGKETTVIGVGRPFIYPDMADLYGFLRSNGYEVWITSAGVSWAVRWMVKNVMNPQITAKYGADAALPLDHVVGITTLLRDKRTGEILTDYGLTQGKPNQAFLNMKPGELANLEILGLPDPLNSWRGGKVGAIQDRITRERPYLAGGDSDGDFEMLNSAHNRLWITRLDKPALQEQVAGQFKIDQPGQWLLQPTISTAPVGFIPTKCALDVKLQKYPNQTTQDEVAESLDSLDPTGQLGSFNSC